MSAACKSSSGTAPVLGPLRGGTDVAALRTRLLQVIERHQSGDLAAAVAGYTQVLAVQPRQFDALRLLGAALLGQGKPVQAIEALDRAIDVRQDFVEVWSLRAQALAQVGRVADAAVSLERCVALRPHDPGALNQLALQYAALGRFGDALERTDRALTFAPQAAPLLSNRGVFLGHLGRKIEAVASHERALAIEPEAAPLRANLAKALFEDGRCEDSVAQYDRVLAQQPAAAIWVARAAPLLALGRISTALASCDRALALDPRETSAWAMRGAVLAAMQRPDDALECFDRALASNPKDVDTQFNRALALLTLGRFKEGWEEYESRKQVGHFVTARAPEVAEWDGSQSLHGRGLLVLCEQGLGDAIQFARFLPELARRGARITLGVRAPLRRLMESVAGVDHVVLEGEALPQVELQCALLSVARNLRVTLESIPAAVPYLSAPQESVNRWRDALMARPCRARVGLVVSGNAEHPNDRNRSLKLEQLASLCSNLRAHNCQWHLLQNEIRAIDVPWLATLGIADHREELVDLAETAALVACMDAIVCVDSCVAHLAGALGRPVFVLLPLSSDWRWMLERTDSPWYPSAHLLRQGQAGNWNDVLEKLSSELDRQLGLATGVACETQKKAASTKPSADSLEAAITAHKAGDFAKAAALYRTQLMRTPDDPDVHRLLGASLLQGGLATQAIEELDRAVNGQSQNAEIWVLRGRALAELGRYAEAAQSLHRALALAPDNAKTWTDHGHAMQSMGNIEQALGSFERAVQLDPTQPQYAVHLAVARLALGDFERGWAGHEARLHVSALSMVPPTNCTYWDGVAALEGRRLLVSSEQGLGDTIQFCRYAPLLAARGARVVLGVQTALGPVLQSLPGVETLLIEGDVLPQVDLQCWLMSLPYLLHCTLERIPAQLPYLRAPSEAVARWHARLGFSADARIAGSVRRIGIACSGNPKHSNDRHRSMSLSSLAPFIQHLHSHGGGVVEWHLLQPQVPLADEPWLRCLGICDHRQQLKDFGETSALISLMDAVVSVDTSVAHLAGALGKPLYLLLPVNADWRWMTGRNDTPWYPGATLLRQKQLDDWTGPLNELETVLLAQLR